MAFNSQKCKHIINARLLTGQKGFAAFYITLLIMVVILGIAGSIFILTRGEQKISGNIV